MQRFKILAVFALLIFSFFMLTALSNAEPQNAARTEDYGSNVDSKKSAVDVAWEREFRLKKQKLKTAVQAYFKKAIATGDIVGAGVSIVQGDSIVLSDGFGKEASMPRKKSMAKPSFD